jgi:hypothetical protein
MATVRPPDFATIADADTKAAFLHERPEEVAWLDAGTRLFKWTQSITNPKGVSPWWQFLESRRLANGHIVPGLRELQEYAGRLGVHDRDYARVRAAVTKQWNKMTTAVAIQLETGAWGYIGKASGQLQDKRVPGVYLIGGEYQVWVPWLTAKSIRRISLLPYLKPNAPFGNP